MGDLADMYLDGRLCSTCGELLSYFPGDGIQYCDKCISKNIPDKKIRISYTNTLKWRFGINAKIYFGKYKNSNC